MARGARGKFGLASASGDTGGLSRRETIIGAVAIAAVLVVFAVFAIVSVTTESEKPELSAGTFFLPYYNDDSTNGAVGFSAVDGGPAGRLAQVPSLVGQTTNNQQWVDVYNSLSGAYLVDRKTGNTSLVLPTLTMANSEPTRLAPPGAGGAAAVEGAAILGFPTDDGIYVVRRAPGSGYPGDVHLLTAGSIAGGVEVGASELPGVLPTDTMVVDEASVAGDSRFAGLGESGRYSDSLAAVASGGALWMVLADDAGSARLVRVSQPGAEAVAEFNESVQDGQTDVAPAALTIEEFGSVGVGTVLTAVPSIDGVAAADPDSSTISLWGPAGSVASSRVDGLEAGVPVYPAVGGSLAWFAVAQPGGLWQMVGVGSSGQVRTAALDSASGIDIAPPVVVGSTALTASRADGRILAINVDSGDAVGVWEGGTYPLDPELDIPSLAASGVRPVDYSAVTVERHGQRVSVNVPAAAQAVLLDSDGNLVELLEKGRAKPIDPNTEIDPNRRGDAEPEPEDEQDEPEQQEVGTIPALQEREGDSSLVCDTTVEQEPRPALLLPQSGERAARAITATWRYTLGSATDCLPSFRIELRELPNGRPEQRDLQRPNATTATLSGLTPATEYEVTVVAFIGDLTSRSNTALFRTGEQGPEQATNLRFTDNGDRWTVEWDACTTAASCDVPATEFDVEWGDGSQIGAGSILVSGSAPRRVTVDITDVNVGRNLCFTVTAFGAANTASSPSEQLCGIRERAPLGAGQFVQARSEKRAGRAVQDVIVTVEGLNSDNFPVVMGTRGTVNVLVQVFGTGQGQFDAGIPGTLSFNSTRIPITVEGVPFGAGSYDYRVTFSNSAGSEVVNGTVALDPISCGPVTVTVTGHNSFNNGAGTWPIVFTPNNPCPRGAAAPALNVIAPPGCLPYPQPLTTQCTTASTSLANGFGYTVLASNPPGFVVDGVNFVSGDGVPALSQPSGPSYTSKVSLQEIARESPTGTTYIVRVRSQDAFGPPNINGCSPLGGSGNVFSFRCSVPDDFTNSQVPVVVTMVPGPAKPRGPYPSLGGTCPSNPAAVIYRPPSPYRPITFNGCTINLTKLKGPDPPPPPFDLTSCPADLVGKTFDELGVTPPPVNAGDPIPGTELYCDYLPLPPPPGYIP